MRFSSLRCLVGLHRWVRLSDARLTSAEGVLDRACTRCGRTEYAA